MMPSHEQKQTTERALHDAYDLTEHILSSLPSAILLADPKQIILWGNPLAHQYFTSGPDTLVGRHLSFVLPAQEVRRLTSAPPGNAEQSEKGCWKHDREFDQNGRVYRYRCFSMVGHRSHQPQTGLVVSDVTEEKRLLEQLIQAEKLASLGTMVSGMAHEINNPAQAILGLAEILKDEESPDTIREYASDIAFYTQHIAAVVRDFCFYARATSRMGETDLDLTKCLVQAVKMVRRGPHFGLVEVESQFGSIPTLRARANEIEQVFVNIIGNAVQAMRGRGRLTLKTWRGNEHIFISISDTGCGIPQALVSRIFDPFFTTKNPGQGTGIGLSIVYKIVNKYGGRISVASEQGVGTTFTIQFPITTESQGGEPWKD